MPTPLQTKVDAIQKKVDDQNAAKAPNYTNVMDPATGKPSISTTPLTGVNQPVPPVVTTSEVRNEFDKNANKLGTIVNTTQAKIDAAKAQYGEEAYNKSVAGKTVNVTGGQPTTTTQTTTTPAPTEWESEYVKTQREIEAQRKAALEKLDASAAERQSLYDSMMAKSDASHQDLLTSIKTQFDQTRNKMVDTNSRFNQITSQNQYLVNGFRYTPQQAEGMVYDTEQAGLAKLGALDSQYSAALTAAQTAKDERDYKNLGDLMDNLDKLQKDRLTILNDMARGAKELSESIDSVENMNENQLNAMNNMMEGYWIDFESVPEADKAKWYEQKAKEISEATGTTISAEYVKSQMSRYNQKAQQAAKAPDLAQSAMRGYYVNAKGDQILTPDGKPIAYNPTDKTVFNEKTGQMIISGTDIYWTPTFKAVSVDGWINPNPTTWVTSTGVGFGELGSVYKGVMPNLINAEVGTLIPTTNPAYKNINNGGMQCGEYVNRITGTAYGDTLAQKKLIGNESTGWVWSTVVIDVGNDIGHVGIIMEDLGNAWKVKSSNYHLDGRVSIDVVPKSKAVGYKTPEAVKMAGSTQYDDERKTIMNQMGEYMRSNKSLTKIQQAELDRLWLTQSQVTAFMDKPFYERATETQKTEAKKLADEAELLLNHPGLEAATGKSSIFNSIPGTSGYDFVTQLDSFIAKLALPNLPLLKWPMSDKDIEFIKQASSSLAKTGQTTEQYKASLMKLIQEATGRSMGTENTGTPGEATTPKSAVDSLTSSGLLN